MTCMKPQLKKMFYYKMNKAIEQMDLKKFDEAFSSLEEAHVLGQKYVIPHTLSHLYMLKIAIKRRDFPEILGQLFRIPTGFLGSLVGILPTGNTGGSNISPFKRMEIPEYLKKYLS